MNLQHLVKHSMTSSLVLGKVFPATPTVSICENQKRKLESYICCHCFAGRESSTSVVDVEAEIKDADWSLKILGYLVIILQLWQPLIFLVHGVGVQNKGTFENSVIFRWPWKRRCRCTVFRTDHGTKKSKWSA